MAFTATERVKIRMYLGYGQRFSDTILARINTAIDALELVPEAEDIAQALLVNLDALHAKFTSASEVQLRIKAIATGSTELPGPMEMEGLRSIGRQLCGQLASMLVVPVEHDIWSPSGPVDDQISFC